MAGARLRALVGAMGDLLLRAGDPWIGRRVRAWLGEEASQGRLSLDGAALRVDGARVPIGSLAISEVRAEIADVVALVARGESPARIDARVEGLEMPRVVATGRVGMSQAGWRVDDGAATSGDARVTFAAHGWFGDAPSASARVTIARLGAPHLRALVARFADAGLVKSSFIPDDARLSGEVTWDSAAGTRAALVVDAGASHVTLDLVVDAHGTLGEVNVAGTIVAADALATGAVPPAAATRVGALGDARASGAIVLRGKDATGAIDVTTATSRVAVEVALASGALDGTRARGTLSFADAFALGLFPGPVRPRRIGAMYADVAVRGALAAPSLVGRVASREVRLRLGDDPELVTIFFHDVEAQLAIDAKRIAWRDLRAKVLGGVARSTGWVALGEVEVEADVAISGVPLETIAVDARGTTPLAEQLRGGLHAEAQIGFVARTSSLTARGRARIVEPDFLFLTAAGERLARYGLPAPATRGAGPVEAEIDVRDRVARATSIVARLEGIDVEGEAAIGFDGALGGELRAHLLQGYLQRSILLAIPASLVDRVTLPIRIAGTAREPDVRADFVHTLDDFLQKNPIGSAVGGVMDGIWGALGGPRSSRPPPSTRDASDATDAIIDRILDGAADSDALLDELVKAGLDEEELERRIAKRRARRG